MEGWIKLHRQLLEWEWYDDHNTFRLFIYMLLKANHKDGKWRGNEILKGSFISSINNLATETGLSNKQVRTSLNKLKKTNEVASKGHSKFTVFEIVKYGEYQQEGKQEGMERANKGQAKGKQRATNKNVKNNKNDKNDKNNGHGPIDFDKLLEFFNQTFNKRCTAFPDKIQKEYLERLKKDYTKENIMDSMINAKSDPFHIDNKYRHCNIEYFSRIKTLDKYSFLSKEKKKYIPTL